MSGACEKKKSRQILGTAETGGATPNLCVRPWKILDTSISVTNNEGIVDVSAQALLRWFDDATFSRKRVAVEHSLHICTYVSQARRTLQHSRISIVSRRMHARSSKRFEGRPSRFLQHQTSLCPFIMGRICTTFPNKALIPRS